MTDGPHAAGTRPDSPRTVDLLRGALPAVLVGVMSAALLWLVDTLAELLEHGVWHSLPELLGVAGDSWQQGFGPVAAGTAQARRPVPTSLGAGR